MNAERPQTPSTPEVVLMNETPPPALAPGDRVTLNSGGPAMTVVSVSDTGEATCQYFDRDAQPRQLKLPLACVKRYEGHAQTRLKDYPREFPYLGTP